MAIDYDTLCKNLGKPIDIIYDYYSNADITYLMKRLRTTSIIRICVPFILLLALIVSFMNIGLKSSITKK